MLLQQSRLEMREETMEGIIGGKLCRVIPDESRIEFENTHRHTHKKNIYAYVYLYPSPILLN